ncbi:MAG: hypothetical protein HY282_16740 [Nitrospirae bacterium]|nr:hypothetical protein [Candidatus Manganitrophaceae bacterium]
MKREEVANIINSKYQRYTAEVINLIKALPSNCRQSGDDSGLKNVWEEWKAQIQGEESPLFYAYEETIRGLCRSVIQALPQDEQSLLWLLSDGYFDSDNDSSSAGAPTLDAVEDELYNRIWSIGADEDLLSDQEEDEDLLGEDHELTATESKINQDKPSYAAKIVGKRIRDVYISRKTDNAATQIILIFTDYDTCVFTIQHSLLEVLFTRVNDPKFDDRLHDKHFKRIDSAVFSGTSDKEVHELYHCLWTKATVDPKYDKAEWRMLGDILRESGFRV